jgi:hypothetical protein
MTYLRPSDYLAASLPALSASWVSSFNEIAGLCGTLLGMAYIVWKWRYEYKNRNGIK